MFLETAAWVVKVLAATDFYIFFLGTFLEVSWTIEKNEPLKVKQKETKRERCHDSLKESKTREIVSYVVDYLNRQLTKFFKISFREIIVCVLISCDHYK